MHADGVLDAIQVKAVFDAVISILTTHSHVRAFHTTVWYSHIGRPEAWSKVDRRAKIIDARSGK